MSPYLLSCPDMPSRPDRATLAAFVGSALIGGSNVGAVRLSNRELPPFWGAGLRFPAAALLMLALVRLRRLPLPRGRALVGTAGFGMLNFAVSYALFYRGAVHVPAGLAGTIMSSVPLLTLFLALAHRQESFRPRGLAGAALAIAGVAIMLAEPPGGPLPMGSVLLIVGSAFCAAESGILVKWIPDTHPITTNAIAMAIGTPFLFVLSRVAGEPWDLPATPGTWAVLGYLAVVTPLLFILYVFVLNRWTASAVSYMFVLLPLVAAVLGLLVADEPVTASLLLGAPLVIAGVWVGALAKEPVPAATPAEPPV